jgi:hypothetical protein
MKWNVAFDSDPAVRFAGDMVIRTGKIFEVGDYPSHDFKLNESEADAAVKAFESAKLNIEHMPTILDGKLGMVSKLWREGKDLVSEYAIPKWLHDVTGAQPIKLSAEWDRAKKQLIGAALVLNPRVKDAAMMAAFAEFAKDSPIQRMHDKSCEMGAECSGKTLFADAATFMTPEALKALQHIHDHCAKNGADCDAYMTRKSMYFSAPAGEPGGKDKPAMNKWEIFTGKLKALFVDAGIEVDGDTKIDPTPAAKVEMSDDAKAKFAAVETQLAEANAAIVALNNARATESKSAQFTADSAAIDGYLRSYRMTPVEAESWKVIAKETPEAFAAAKPALDKRSPLPQLVGFGGLNADQLRATVENGSTAGEKLVAMAHQRVKETKEDYAVAFTTVCRANPDLAREHAEAAPSYRR